jgi:CheY-like chemotaxis protein
VLGFTRLMLEDPTQRLAPKQIEHLKHIRDAGEHLLALIDDVLDLTSVELSRLALASEPVALAPLVGETLQWVAPAAQRAQVMLSQGALDAAVIGDERRLRQVVANLLSNAVKYNRPGGRVDVSVLSGDEQWVAVCVRDTGRGLSAAQRRSLFEPFNRLGAERNGIEGTGIGLTIVRALVDAMGGRIEVDSTPGVGSEFRVWLPRAQAPAAAPSAGAPPLHAPAAELPAIDVLYVEDNRANVALLQALVELRPNVRLHVAPDGRSGIASAKHLRPQVVLLDIELPDIDGREVLRVLRADPTLSRSVCIALSADAAPEETARALRIGFDDYWTKPIDVAAVLDRLDALARGERATAQRRA